MHFLVTDIRFSTGWRYYADAFPGVFFWLVLWWLLVTRRRFELESLMEVEPSLVWQSSLLPDACKCSSERWLTVSWWWSCHQYHLTLHSFSMVGWGWAGGGRGIWTAQCKFQWFEYCVCLCPFSLPFFVSQMWVDSACSTLFFRLRDRPGHGHMFRHRCSQRSLLPAMRRAFRL